MERKNGRRGLISVYDAVKSGNLVCLDMTRKGIGEC